MGSKGFSRTRALVGATLAVCCGLGLAPTRIDAAAKVAKVATPLRFEEAADTASGVRFVARGDGFAAGFATGGVELSLGGARARVRFAGASTVAPAGEAELPGRSNVIRGTDPAAWRIGLKGFARVRYAGLYPGVDAVCYGAGRELEYDFVVAPGADPRALRLAFDGVASVALSPDGALVARTSAGEIRQRPPVAYQETARGRETVACRYDLRGAEARLVVGAYDRALPLVVDPVLGYATYFGGSGFDDLRAMTVDAAGNVCVAGNTSSPDFPVLGGPAPDGDVDIFVAKLSPSGRELLYSTTIGSPSYDTGFAIAADAAGNVFVAGRSNAPTFPLVRPLASSAHDTVLFKLDPTGAPLFSTYFGGNDDNGIYGLATAPSGDLLVVGDTNSLDFPTTNAIQASPGGGATDAFLARLRNDGQEILFSTYLGGSAVDTAYAVASDASGAAYVVGVTGGGFPTTPGALLPDPPDCEGSGSCDDAFVAKIDASNALVYSTYLGGGSRDAAYGIAVDASGGAYVVGETVSLDFPTKDAVQPERAGVSSDGFVTELTADGTGLVYSTYLGGAGANDSIARVAVDAAGRAYVVGNHFSTDFPTVDSVQGYVGPSEALSAVLAVLDPTGSRLEFATFYEASDAVAMTGVAFSKSGDVYVAGTTNAADLALADPLFPFPGDTDGGPTGFVARFDDVLGGPVPPKVTGVRAKRKAGKMSKVLVDGENFQPGMRIYVGADDAPWASVKEGDGTSVVLRDTSDLLRTLPPGSRTRLRCVNPDGGEFTAYVELE